MSKKAHILICDDDASIRSALGLILDSKYQVSEAASFEELKKLTAKRSFDLLILDIGLSTELEGLERLPEVRAMDSEMSIVMHTGNADTSLIRRAFLSGADDFLFKSSDTTELLRSIERFLNNQSQRKQLGQSQFEAQQNQKSLQFIGQSKAIDEVRGVIEKLKRRPTNVVIHGETGTGKEVVARLLRWSNADGSLCPFVSLDCSTITSSLAESILFGHEKGAFTGADTLQKGIFEQADGGILFLDEIANMQPEVQAKFLRVLQEKEVRRVGSQRTIEVDFTVVSASNLKLEDLVSEKQFKHDLYQRLAVIQIQLPALKERREDIVALAEHFLRLEGEDRFFSEEAQQALTDYAWPGNIRELKNMVSYLITLSDGESFELADLPPHIRVSEPEDSKCIQTDTPENFYERVLDYEKSILRSEYEKHKGNVSRLALNLGMDRSHAYKKLRQHQIHSPKKL